MGQEMLTDLGHLVLLKMEIITLSEICESIYRSFSKFEDIKEVMRNHISINRRQWNGQKKKDGICYPNWST
jgi:hypothetical protein